ncbi:hypothetical protein J7T55_010569 [Diaporthe amygdali]|uniref:uncharacterized protein n=1 Tax=Phomopsis amygdali TaxID=1214568 RepID=UPI0022FEC519|nr:uncharacterized protein J7T55_010569 [Diaporthe amygdali]KAJ0115746.1 hypothetical protein J7T55_010569 [Diaporthe amygdali]
MAPSNSPESTSSPDEDLKNLATAANGAANTTSQMRDNMTFHYFIQLPPELQSMIRTEAIDQALRNAIGRPFKGGPLASVSKEWKNDVEMRLFSRIRINPSKERHVLRFREFFTNERRRFLSQLEITIDDRWTGPWHRDMGIVQISQVMEKIGHLLQYLQSWEVHRDEEQPRSIEIIFVSMSNTLDPSLTTRLCSSIHTSSLWEGSDLDMVTGSGQIPTNVALWAIKSEFPSTLDMVTHLTFPLDCVPLPAAQAMIQRMQNLKSCDFEIKVNASQLGWRNLSDFVISLPTLAPSLRCLRISGSYVFFETFTSTLKKFSAVLRDYSQSLERLDVSDLPLHQAFFQPFSDEFGINAAMSEWRWPKLETLELIFANFAPYLEPGRLKLTPAEVLIAAGRAAMAMPVLKYFHAGIVEEAADSKNKYFWIARELNASLESSGKARITFKGFNTDERRRILAAWLPWMGAEARFVREMFDDDTLDDNDSNKVESDGQQSAQSIGLETFYSFPEDKGLVIMSERQMQLAATKMLGQDSSD